MVNHRINAQRAVNSLEETTDPRNLSIGFEALASAVLAVHDLLDERLPHAVSNETRATLDVSAQQRTVQEKATQDFEIEGDWLIEVVNYHTCGAGPGSGADHEPGCGTIPVGRLATPEHDAAVAARALREAAAAWAADPDSVDDETPADARNWLRERADQIDTESKQKP